MFVKKMLTETSYMVMKITIIIILLLLLLFINVLFVVSSKGADNTNELISKNRIKLKNHKFYLIKNYFCGPVTGPEWPRATGWW
jgi:hypothetical protein